MTTHPGIHFLGTLAPWNGKGGFGLDCIRRVADAWGNPQDATKSVHIAGTNGKGSVSAYLATILGHSGKKVGLTTSPHLSRINERVILNGLPISDDELSDYAMELKEFIEKTQGELSFFEAITLIFFHACQVRKMDWMVVEVGLGGRLVVTKIIARPEVCCVTTIDLDHQDILGDSLEKIAREKGGIIKPGARLIIGERKLGPRAVLQSLGAAAHVPMFTIGDDYDWRLVQDGAQLPGVFGAECFEYWDKSQAGFPLRTNLNGQYQLDNAAMAFAAASSIGLSPETIANGILKTRWPGRLEALEYAGRACLLDAGHNPAGIRALTNYLKKQRITAVEIGFGVLKTKSWREMVDELLPFVERWNLLRPDSGAAVDPSEVGDYLSGRGVNSENYGSDYEGFLSDMKRSPSTLPLLMAGSIYMMGQLRSLIVKQDKPMW